MPKSVASFRSLASQHISEDDEDEFGEHEAEAIRNAYRNAATSQTLPPPPTTAPVSPAQPRSRRPSRGLVDETTSLLFSPSEGRDGYRTLPASIPGTPRHTLSRQHSQLNASRRNHSRKNSIGLRLARVLATDANQTEPNPLAASTASIFGDDRLHYDQFTSTDWIHDNVADALRVKELRSRKDWKGRIQALFDSAQGWIIVAIIGIATAGFAYLVDVTEIAIFDFKSGYCSKSWVSSKSMCCAGASQCKDWNKWSSIIGLGDERNDVWIDFSAFVLWVVVLAVLACLVTLQTRTVITSAVSLSTLDENLGADSNNFFRYSDEGGKSNLGPTSRQRPPLIYYPAAGSGVAEVKVILSGFVLHGYLGLKTLICKTIGLVLSVASGLSIGKEGPYVHIATCVGNIACRMFTKYRTNDSKRREVLSASAAAGVAVAFGAPIGGVLFSLEEVSYYFPPKTLFRTFFCCIAAALSLKFLDPYGTGKIVLFQVRYLTDWLSFEVPIYILVSIMGGALGACFIKVSKIWAQTFRRITIIKKYPILEVFLVALVTGLVSFWNRYTRLPVAELLYELAAPCASFSDSGTGLCPTYERIPETLIYLFIAFLIKAALTVVSFGIKVPAGIYVPSMVVGGLLGRFVGHLVQLIIIRFPHLAFFAHCAVDGNPEACVVPGVYALIAAGATMCGVTRLSVTLAVILFELTGSLEHVLPFALAVMVAKWTADAIEPLSIYDLLTDMNSYPYLDSKARPAFSTDLGDLATPLKRTRIIDISESPLVPAQELRAKLNYLHVAGELDSALPIIRHGVLAGLVPCPDLEFALDRLENENNALCLMSPDPKWQGPGGGNMADIDLESEFDGISMYDAGNSSASRRGQGGLPNGDPTDFRPYIDPAPVSLDIRSPMELVFECFVKLGLRYVCVLNEGKFAGLVHKKAFVRHVKDVQEHGG
ncbi:Hypothetical protein R9X50_00593300 [Acrodontium crateriforme]|uniref:Chloride channel protein n=1 Tax=Acrodontium crateriforme TaxID=150365 RepID=A0AAQ3R9I2_9PEZI|nr:Hypothetical protein R9X50_00593300 [Acrodontium crateriforme]